MAMKGEQVTIHELKPQKTIQAAVSAASSHVKAVNAQAGNAMTSGAGATIVKGKGKGQGE